MTKTCISTVNSEYPIKAAIFQESVLGKPSDVLMVGDRPEDEQAAQNAGVKFMWSDSWRNGAEALI